MLPIVTPEEMRVVDDASDDCSSGLLTELERNPRITVIRQATNVGLTASCNSALRASSADFVMRLDADDYLMPSAVRTMADAIAVMRAVGHDVTVLHIMDPVERDLSLDANEVELVDTEGPSAVHATVSEMREAYRETVELAMSEWRSRLAASGASYMPVFTDQPFGVPLRAAFAARQALP